MMLPPKALAKPQPKSPLLYLLISLLKSPLLLPVALLFCTVSCADPDLDPTPCDGCDATPTSDYISLASCDTPAIAAYAEHSLARELDFISTSYTEADLEQRMLDLCTFGHINDYFLKPVHMFTPTESDDPALRRAIVLAGDSVGNPFWYLTPEDLVLKESYGGNAPVSATIVRVTPFSETELDTWEVGDYPALVSMVMDYSVSLSDTDKDTVEGSYVNLATNLELPYRGEVIKFDGRADVMQALTSDRELLRQAIYADHSRGDTAFWDASLLSMANLAAADGRFRSSMIFTDGPDNASVYSADSVFSKVNSLRFPLLIVGTGELDVYLLNALADDSSGLFYYAPTGDAIPDALLYLKGHLDNALLVEWISPGNQPLESTSIDLHFIWDDESGIDEPDPSPTPETNTGDDDSSVGDDDTSGDDDTTGGTGDDDVTTSSPAPGSEVCNGTDDDADGYIDEETVGSDAFEPNDTRDTASYIGDVSSSTANVQLTLPNPTDEDWFRLTAAISTEQTAYITASLSGFPTGTIMSIEIYGDSNIPLNGINYSANGSLVFEAQDPASSSRSGTWRIRVRHGSGAFGCSAYLLSVAAR